MNFSAVQKKTVVQIRDCNPEVSFLLMDITDLDLLGHLQNTVVLNCPISSGLASKTVSLSLS